MSDPTFFRARLTGVAIEDPTDPAPAGQKRAIVTYVEGDSDVTGSATILGKALVVGPDNIPVTLAATNSFFFGRPDGPVSLPLARNVQPRVIIRRDATSDAGTAASMSVVMEGGFRDHAHLVPGIGPGGGGVAFAAFAPSTKDEASALGYTDLL